MILRVMAMVRQGMLKQLAKDSDLSQEVTKLVSQQIQNKSIVQLTTRPLIVHL